MITGPGRRYHPACLVCAECGAVLATNFYRREGGGNYCEEHREPEAGPCRVCGAGVRGGLEGPGGAVYHPACLACSHCSAQLTDRFYSEAGGGLACLSCHTATLPHCAHCNKPLTQKLLRALDQTFHPDCFR